MITPILLCGGSGTRLWPLSRKSYPKQFARLLGDNSLLQDTALRTSGEGFAAPIVVTGTDFRFIVAEQLAEVGITPAVILIEPEGRNTAPAIAAAVLWSQQITPDTTLLVLPADHAIADTESFRQAVGATKGAVDAGQLVAVGIKPTYAETGFGYLELAQSAAGSQVAVSTVPVARFIEKPDLETAQSLLEQINVLWNAGIFAFRTTAILDAFAAHAATLLPLAQAALRDGTRDPDFVRLAPAPWKQIEDISIDYAVMERAENVSALRYDGVWSDVGGWHSVWKEMDKDADGVASMGNVTAIDCSNTLLRSEDPRVELVGIGLEDIIAVATPDAVLVSRRGRGEDVKKAVAILKAKGARQALSFPKDYRPWGWYESLALGGRFQVKRIQVDPGGKLSLQSHYHRSEHWIIVEGTAIVTLDEEQTVLTENQSIYIPLGSRHRIENPGKVPVLMIEVQTGTYLGEDDIIRYEDVYARS
ncbi:MAG: mannose-1-phosphate guanylyltransferase/mannose-6-phosphate isomerase [Sulfitobacter sp.]